MNEHIALKKGGDEIAVLGVENWGAAMRFPKYGKIEQAHAGTEKYPVKLLLSHDPSHWDAQIRKQYPDIDVTFSGHTHGMQFGIEIPGFRWSPSKYIYKQWADLYREGNQYIYVNRGLGFLGYPGRVGILPEITVVELCNA
jgi:predicted MPP superfamily phosphohydrolase